jgi:hypothetical protein
MQNMKTEWSYGPDDMRPAVSHTASKLDQAVKIRDHSKQPIDSRTVSVFTRFKNTVKREPKKIALGKFGKKW